jgi:LacI family transcriptional regulator, galactose operon repressor
VEGDFYAESGEQAMASMLALPDPPTAVFAAADMMAIGAIRAVQAAGRVVPGDVAVVGFDDIRVAELLSPPLTTIRQDMVGIGLAAGRALVEQIEDPDATPPVLTLPVELVVRASCGANGDAAAD